MLRKYEGTQSTRIQQPMRSHDDWKGIKPLQNAFPFLRQGSGTGSDYRSARILARRITLKPPANLPSFQPRTLTQALPAPPL